MSVIDLSKVNEIVLRSDEIPYSETVLKTSALWGNPANFKQVKFPLKLAKNLFDFTGNEICRVIPPSGDGYWLYHLYMDEDKVMTLDVFNGESNFLTYSSDKAFIVGLNGVTVTSIENNSIRNLKALNALDKILAYAVKNNIADIWYICNEWDYSWGINDINESLKDTVKAVPNGDGKNVDLLIEDTYKRGTAMVYKYSGLEDKEATGKWVQSGEYCLVIC